MTGAGRSNGGNMTSPTNPSIRSIRPDRIDRTRSAQRSIPLRARLAQRDGGLTVRRRELGGERTPDGEDASVETGHRRAGGTDVDWGSALQCYDASDSAQDLAYLYYLPSVRPGYGSHPRSPNGVRTRVSTLRVFSRVIQRPAAPP
jgi:hypothetical protein